MKVNKTAYAIRQMLRFRNTDANMYVFWRNVYEQYVKEGIA